MKELNKLRLLSGIPIDVSIEKTEKKEVVAEAEVITEARAIPRKSERTPKDEKSLTKGIACLKIAIKHVKLGIKALDKVPATDYMGDVPEFIQQLEEVVSGGSDGLESYLKTCEDGLRKFKRAEKKAITEADDDADDKDEDDDETEMVARSQKSDIEGEDDDKDDDGIDDDIDAEIDNADDDKDSDDDTDDDDIDAEIDESMHFFANMNKDYEEDEAKPINVSNGSSNDEQVWDAKAKENLKDENPEQLRTSDEKSEQDQSDGADIEADMKIPASIKKSLAGAIADAKAEAKKMSVSNKEASYFYNDLAKAFDDLKNHLDKGTRYDFKLAQTFAQSLMGPMLHKIPVDVWKFLTNGGETRSLKDYMKPVKNYIEGPRNTIK